MAKRNPERLEVTKIRYSRDVIDEQFDNGKKMSDVLSDLRTGLLDLDTLPKITVVRKGKLFFTLNNRRLWVFQQYAQFLQENRNEILQVTVKFESMARLDPTWLTTTSEGEFIKVRHNGSPEAHADIVTVKLSEICYSSESITGKKTNVEKKFDALLGTVHEPAQLPVLKVVKRQEILYALDNDQLWMIKQWYRYKSIGTEGKQSMCLYSRNDDINSDEGATGNSDLQDDNHVDICEDFTVKVELRPQNELPEHFSTLDAGKNIEFRNRNSKHGVPNFNHSLEKSPVKARKVMQNMANVTRTNQMTHLGSLRNKTNETLSWQLIIFIFGLKRILLRYNGRYKVFSRYVGFDMSAAFIVLLKYIQRTDPRVTVYDDNDALTSFR